MSQKVWKKAPQELIDLFYLVMKNFPEAELKKMFGYPCAFYNGNMFVGLHEDNLVVRLQKQELDKAFTSKIGTPFEPMKGRVMKEYLALEKKLLSDVKQVILFIAKAMDYVKTLRKKVKKPKQKKVHV